MVSRTGLGGNTKRRTERREIPNGAEFRRTRNPEERGIPESGTTKSEERRAARAAQREGADAGARALVAFSSSARRDFALFGIPRSSGFRALRDFRAVPALRHGLRGDDSSL